MLVTPAMERRLDSLVTEESNRLLERDSLIRCTERGTMAVHAYSRTTVREAAEERSVLSLVRVDGPGTGPIWRLGQQAAGIYLYRMLYGIHVKSIATSRVCSGDV